MRDQWEHKVVALDAVTSEKRQRGTPRHSPQTLIPQLDEYGEQGWELVSVQPVFMGENEDITYYGDSWTHHYLCFFKRRKAEK